MTTILDLPPELVGRIASNLTTDQLGPFRCSCKQIEKYIFPTFAKEFFTKRQFMIEHESLLALKGIADHPGLAPYLSEVIIGTQFFSPKHLLSGETDHLLERRLHCGLLERDVLLATGTAQHLLKEAFSKLSNLKVIGLRDYDGLGRERDGSAATWKSWGWKYAEELYQTNLDVGNYLPLIMTSLATSRARPEQIQVFLRGRVQLPGSAFMMPNIPEITSVQDNLTTVMLSISRDYTHRLRLPYPEACALGQTPMRKFLSSLKNLQYLRLNFASREVAESLLKWLSGDPGHQFSLQSPEYPNLSRLDIGHTYVDIDILVKVLNRFCLKAISLWRISLLSGEGDNFWSELLTKLAPAATGLERLELGWCRQCMPGDQEPIAVSWFPRRKRYESGTTPDPTIIYHAQVVRETAKEFLQEVSGLAWVVMPDTSSSGDDGGDDDDDDTSFGGSDGDDDV